jgi:hypothetical protein
MTITELINRLKEYKEKYGDLPITCNSKEFFIFLIKDEYFDIQENFGHIDDDN